MSSLAELIGDSPGLVAVRRQVEHLLQRQSETRRLPPILILGETGTGKGLLARALHDAGPRKAGPFVAVNCAAIPETLLEAELFGYERGAFTDAREAKAGLFQAAHRGTLFLDEIGLLPQNLQPKLLTALEDRAVRRLGGTRPEPIDVWIISATSEDLTAARRRGFREELYHRLAVVTLRLPPLRERGQDILTLAEHFLTLTCTEYGLAPKTLTEDARAALIAYRWPGNVRELANVMERAGLLVDGPLVKADGLELAVPRTRRASTNGDHERPSSDAPVGIPLGQTIEEIERQHILDALHETQWNISRTAARLGVTRNVLRYRIQKYGLRLPPANDESTEPPDSVCDAVEPTTGEGRPKVQWERRHIAVLRADLDMTAPVGGASTGGAGLETLVEKIESFGGRVEEVSPEGVVAVYGLEPIEDASRRAAHAALAIQRVAARADGIAPECPGVRVGLHVGEFLVARVGNAPRVDHSAKREAWRQLEGFMGGAEPGTVLVSAPARPFLERRFVLVPFARTRGTSESVYRLEGLERTGLGLGDQLTPFVARDRELEQLAQALEQAQTGHGQVVGVVGEAGVGKSRLLWEFINSRRIQNSLTLLSSAASYARATPYLPVIDLLKTYFHIEPRDDADKIRERVTEKLALERALAPALSALLALLDVPADEAKWRELDPRQKRRLTLEAVKLLLLEESRRQPLILVFEDLHWIDAETQSVLDTLVESLSSHRVLLLVSYRPEYQHTWGNKSCYAQLRLDPLSPENAHALLDRLVGPDETAATVRAELIERTGGNPFFLEESVRTLVETRVLVGDRGTYRLGQPFGGIQVPPTVKAVLAARVDRLAREDRALLQAAAVIGRDVPLAPLLAAADLPEEALQAGLTRLRASEFLHETRLVPEPEYAFKHALTHEVVYSGLLEDQRRVLHARIMAAIERLHAHRLGEQVDRLAHHALRGEVWDKAAVYFRQAGVKAAERSAYRDAVGCFENALGALSHLPETSETTEQGIDLRMELRNSLNPLGNIRRCFEAVCEAEILAERIGDQRRLGWLSAYAALHHWQSSDLDRAVESGRRALATAQTCGDFVLQVVASLHLGQAHLGLGDLRRAKEYLQSNVQSLAGDRIRERLGERLLPSVASRLWLVHVLVERGEFAEAIARGEEAAEIAEAVDHPASLISAYRGLGYLYLRKGDLDRAIQFLERCGELSRVWDIPAMRNGIVAYMGHAYVLSGRLAEGLRLLEHATTGPGASRQDLTGYAVNRVYLSEAYALANREEDALRTVNQALEFARDRKRRHQEAWALRALGEIAAHRDPPEGETAEASYRQAMVLADELGMPPVVADCHLGLGKLYGRAGKRQEASEHLTTAATMYRAMDMTFWLEKTEAVMESSRL
jgi:DNA-binding NtrC family response regulator/tetratricopeptide (TPR) repeat protein